MTVQQIEQLHTRPQHTADIDLGFTVVPAICEADRTHIAQLTGQQQRVFALLSEGLSNKEIARILGLHESTVKVHVSAVLARLSCRNRTIAALLSLRYQLSLAYREARRMRAQGAADEVRPCSQPARI